MQRFPLNWLYCTPFAALSQLACFHRTLSFRGCCVLLGSVTLPLFRLHAVPSSLIAPWLSPCRKVRCILVCPPACIATALCEPPTTPRPAPPHLTPPEPLSHSAPVGSDAGRGRPISYSLLSSPNALSEALPAAISVLAESPCASCTPAARLFHPPSRVAADSLSTEPGASVWA